MDNRLEKLMEEVGEFIKSKGIQTFVFMARDPDSDKSFNTFSGEIPWCVGACDLLKDDIISGQFDKEG